MPKKERDEAVAELVSARLLARVPGHSAHTGLVLNDGGLRAEFDHVLGDAGGHPHGRRAAVAQGDRARQGGV